MFNFRVTCKSVWMCYTKICLTYAKAAFEQEPSDPSC